MSAITAYMVLYPRLETVMTMYSGLGATLPLPLRFHIFSVRSLSWVALPLVAIAALWLWRRNPDGLGAAKLISASGLIAFVWIIAGVMLMLHTLAFELIKELT